MRINQPGGKFYKTDYLRQLCDLWDFRGSGITNMHGSTGDIIFLGTTTPQLEEIFYELTHKFNQDLGGSGSNLRTPADCIGQARCEYACYDTQALCYDLTNEYQDELHRPAFPYKFKFKFDGCPNCCVASIARVRTCPLLEPGGMTSGSIRKRWPSLYVGGETCTQWRSPQPEKTGASSISRRKLWTVVLRNACAYEDGKTLKINNKEMRTRCMHCINVMPRKLYGSDWTNADAEHSGGRQGPHPGRCADGLPFGSISSKVEERLYTKIKEEVIEPSGIGGWKKARTANVWAS